jgi:AcrR family transcriptional regulator
VSANRANGPLDDRTSYRDGRDLRRAERRNALLDAAIDAIRTIGPGATMEQLAKAGGVTKPILYRHFGDREGLITAIAERFSAELLESVQRPLTSLAYPRELLDATVGGYVAFLEQDPFLYGFLIQQPSNRASDHHSPIGSLVDVVAKQVAQISGEQLQAAGRDSGAAVPWGYGIVGLVHTATNWWLRDQTMSRERFVGYLTDLLWHGLTGAAAPAEEIAGT